ncbi:MAG: hypothetical protein DMG07_24875 [Acidobacteria bacterium]|nr:MAG: hypothetical protein DMG07_24875 [Acidobacteriota bacterium]
MSAAVYSVPADPALPSLQELFPVSGAPGFVARMVQEVADRPVTPESAELCHVRYRPTRNCVVLWSFSNPSGVPFLVSGLSGDGTGGTARASFERSAEMVRAALGGKCPYQYVPERRLLLQVFPLDTRLPGLALAASETRIREPFCRSLGLDCEHVRITDLVPVNYKPWRRCVLRYGVEIRGRPVQYFGKVFRDDRGEPMAARLRAVRDQLLASGSSWDLAAPASYVPEARMLVLEGVEHSEELSAFLRQAVYDPQARETLEDEIARIAEGLRAFQSIAVEGLPCVGPQDVLSDHEAELDGLLHVAPALAESMRVRLRTLEVTASRLPAEEMVLGHGAFRYNQFLRSGEKLIILDLDALRLAGAGADAGEFLAYLDLAALRGSRLRPILPTCEEVFLSHLSERGRADPRWVAWYRAAAHVKWAQRTFFSLRPEWPDLTRGLLQAADQMLGGLPA